MGRALILLIFLSGCQTISFDNPRSVWCQFNEPRRDATPTTPRAELDKINAHNIKGVQWCNWKP